MDGIWYVLCINYMKSIVKHFSAANILFEGLSEVRAALNYMGRYINMMNMIMF